MFILKSKQIFSITLSLLMVFMAFSSAASFANDLTDETLKNTEYYDYEEVILSMDGFIYTSISKNDNIIIKAYSEDGNLIEEVILDKVANTIKSINYINDDVNFKSVHEEEIIDLNEFQIDDDYQMKSLESSRNILGRTIYRSNSQPYYRAMSVEYLKFEDMVSFTVPTAMNTIPKLIGFIIGYIPVPSNIAGKIVAGLIGSNIIEKIADELYFKQFDVSAYMTQCTFWGIDGNYRGSIDGKLYEVQTKDSRYYKDQFKEGIYLDPIEWGNGSISRALQYQVYGGFMSNLTYVSEGR